jgi:hypothetical protein
MNELQNPRSEIRNPKEARNLKSETRKSDVRMMFPDSTFGFLSDFDLRISDLPSLP